jgi:4'-phosphopantetheinyl transferase
MISNAAKATWDPPPRSLEPARDEVHLWRARLDLPSRQLDELWHTLDDAERLRAGRLLRRRDRNAMVAARGMLRDVLSRYVDLPPAGVRFAYGPYGKPLLLDGSDPARVRFNLAHSGDVALCAVALDVEVGIDIELVRPNVDVVGIAERFFSASEAERLRALDGELRSKAFFACWTRKEAYVKATGRGVGLRLDFVAAGAVPDGPTAVPMVNEEAARARWLLFDVNVGPRYAAALATIAPPSRLRLWQWA